MSAAAVQATSPHHSEAIAYWDELTLQCRRHVTAINEVLVENGLPEQHGVQWRPGRLGVSMARDSYPSTEINLRLSFEHWGPFISGLVRGCQDEDLRFYPDEFEYTIGTDENGQPVAITGEGRSLSPHEFAKYLAQNFRRCYPGISLPSPETPLE
jgi:hypothetical protein